MTREEAIAILEVSKHMATSGRLYNQAIDMAIEALSAEPKTGKWVLDPNGMDWSIPAWRCSECGFVATHIGIGSDPMRWAGSKFCPNCGSYNGARMVGEEE